MDLNLSGKIAVVTGALTNFCKEFGPRGVRVNTVSPGRVETNLWLGDDGVAATVARAKGGQPRRGRQAGRCDRAGNVTGTDVLIDGGLVKTL